jgi:HlyD family secretion protein
MAGVLQAVPVEVGQRVVPGANLARVADPARLKAQVKIPETQARDIAIGLPASVDLRTGAPPVTGRVARVDPAAQGGTVLVDIGFEPGTVLPKGARPDLGVEGSVELERLADVLIVGRPAFGQEDSAVSLFKLSPDGVGAVRTRVRLGRGSVNQIEVKEGLQAGDKVILSDTNAYDTHERIRLN